MDVIAALLGRAGCVKDVFDRVPAAVIGSLESIILRSLAYGNLHVIAPIEGGLFVTVPAIGLVVHIKLLLEIVFLCGISLDNVCILETAQRVEMPGCANGNRVLFPHCFNVFIQRSPHRNRAGFLVHRLNGLRGRIVARVGFYASRFY
jgi:hypothetical protein